MSNGSEHDRAKADDEAAIGLFQHANRFARQCLVDIDRAATPLDLAAMANASDRTLGTIFGRAQDPIPTPWRGHKMFGRSVVLQGLVRTLLIVQTLE